MQRARFNGSTFELILWSIVDW